MSVTAYDTDPDSLRALLAIYVEAESFILKQVAQNIARGIDLPHWQEVKLLEVQAMLSTIRARLQGIVPRSAAEIDRALTAAYNRGDMQAVAALSHEANIRRDSLTGLARSAGLMRLIGETQGAVIGQHAAILRSTSDIYRRVIAHTVLLEQTGVMTRRQAAELALVKFASAGVVSYTTSNGRRLGIESYTEMAMRTAIQRSSLQGHVDRLQERGHNLVFVTDHTQECERCRPFEGKILSLNGYDPRAVTTLDSAQAQGLMHPGCRHQVSAYIEGLSKPPTDTADPQGDQDRQRLRAMERRTREWERRKLLALTPAEKKRAAGKVREWKAEITHHTNTTSAKRQRFRESATQAR